MKGARALASGMLVLVAICAVPAISAAQDSGTPADDRHNHYDDQPRTGPRSDAGGPGDTQPSQPDKQPGDSGNQGPATEPLAESPDPPVTTTVSGPTGRARSASSTSVDTGDFFFSPGTVTIDTGDTVTWHNSGQAPHTATANNGSFDTGTINSGGSASHTFNSAGTFSYICTIHPNMKGTIRVVSAGGSGGGGASSSSSGTSEASAVASPDAAGTSSTLPMTGMAVGGLALVGAALLAGGLITRRSPARD